MYLPDKALNEMKLNDVEKYSVVKVSDEIVIDLMKSACGIDYQEGSKFINNIRIKDVNIPFPSIELLYKMKQTYHDKDKLDKLFLEEILKRNRRKKTNMDRTFNKAKILKKLKNGIQNIR